MKVVINTCWGGFSLSKAGNIRLQQLDSSLTNDRDSSPQFRSHWALVAVVEELRAKANGAHADLRIVEIPYEIGEYNWHIHEYDGQEHVAENHRTWR